MDEKDTRAGGQQRLLDTLERLLTIQETSVHGALDEASQWVAEALGADKADAFLHDPATDSLVALGTSDTPMGRLQHRLGLNRLPLANGGRAVAVYQTGTPFRSGHTDDDPDEILGMKQGLGVHSTVAAPIEVDRERRGVLIASAARPDAFSGEDLRFTEAVGRWIGLVAHRAELIERVTREAAEQARRVAATEMVTVLAHDLRTPLTPLRGYLDMLRKGARRDGRDADARHADQATLAVDRLQRMISDLLDAGRLDQGIFALSPRLLDLTDLTRETAEVLRAPEAVIRVEAPDDLVLQADPERLQQALENLIGNAIAHSPASVPVVVEETLGSARRGDVGHALGTRRGAGHRAQPPAHAVRPFLAWVRLGRPGSGPVPGARDRRGPRRHAHRAIAAGSRDDLLPVVTAVRGTGKRKKGRRPFSRDVRASLWRRSRGREHAGDGVQHVVQGEVLGDERRVAIRPRRWR